MPAHKRKPNYNGATTMEELLASIYAIIIAKDKKQVWKT